MCLRKRNDRDRMRRIDAFESSFGWKVRATVALVLILGMPAAAVALEGKGYEVSLLSSRADAVSGEDVLVELIEPAANASVQVLLNGEDVTMAFLPTSNPAGPPIHSSNL